MEMGFQGFAIEASYADCVPIIDYVLNGKGNRKNVLTGQGYVAWNTHEFLEMIDWIRACNEEVPDNKRIGFYGMDYGHNDFGAQAVSSYLRKNGIINNQGADSLLQTIAILGRKHWPRSTGDIQQALKAALPELQQLIDNPVQNKEKLNSTDTQEHTEVMLYMSAMKQFLLNNIKDSLPEFAHPNRFRSRGMAIDQFRILDIDKSVEKLVVWVHHVHVSVGQPENGEPSLGYELRKKFSAAYYAV